MVNLCLKIYSKYISTSMQEWMLRLRIATLRRIYKNKKAERTTLLARVLQDAELGF